MSKELTRQAIIASFMKLLNERPLDKITIKDIVLDCGINRNTFYYHYQDIRALVEDIFVSEARKVIEEHPLHDSWQEGFLQSTQFAIQNKRAIYHIYNSADHDQLERYLYGIAQEMMLSFVQEQARGLRVSEVDVNYIALFYKHAVVGIVLEWLQRGMKDDPEAAIREIGRIFDGNIRSTLERLQAR